MKILTQRNATIFFALAAAWGGAHLAYPNLLSPKTEEWVQFIGMFVGIFLVSLGFTRTPAGNPLPPDTVTQIDRQAVLAKAGDAVVDAVAQKVTAEAKDANKL